MADATWGEIYDDIGISPIINAIGSVTLLGGSTPPDEVREAMEAANTAYAPMATLEEKAGALVADMLGVPAAYITSGAGSALTLATAAFMAGDNDEFIEQLPNTDGMKNEILIQKRQRYWYDRCLELAGARLVEFGNEDRTRPEDLQSAINNKTAAVHYVADERAGKYDPNALSLEETVEIAHAAEIPVMVDAAGQVYPLENLSKYVKAGADFSCIGAKYIGAPHSTGLALGTNETIRKLALHSFVGYESRRIRSIGRPQKLDRQELVGLVAAVRRWMTLNHEERLAQFESRSQIMVTELQGIPGVKAALIDNVVGNQPFGVKLEIDEQITPLNYDQLVANLKDSDPPIWTRVVDGFISLSVFGLNEGEEDIVGKRIAELLSP